MKRDIEYFTDHSLKDSDARVYEHETMLSFINDSGNYAFNEWWSGEGFRAYRLWCEANLEELNENYS